MTRTGRMSGLHSTRMAGIYYEGNDLEPNLEVDQLLEADDGRSEDEMVVEARVDPYMPWHVIMDFDKTITVNDTIEPLVCQAILYNYEHVIDGGGRSLQLREVAWTQQWQEWLECKRRYARDLQEMMEGVKRNEEFLRDAQSGMFEDRERKRPPRYLKSFKRTAEEDAWAGQDVLDGELFNKAPRADYSDRRGYLPEKYGTDRPAVGMRSRHGAFQSGYLDTIWNEVEILDIPRAVEEISVERVNRTGIFDHVGRAHALRTRTMVSNRQLTPAEIAAGRRFPEYGVQIRPGFKEFIKNVESRPGATWGVVSVNWSKDWIQGIVSRALGSKEPLDFPILSNNLVPPEEIVNKGGTRTDHGIAGAPLWPTTSSQISRPKSSRSLQAAAAQPLPSSKVQIRFVASNGRPSYHYNLPSKFLTELQPPNEAELTLILSARDKLRAMELLFPDWIQALRSARPHNIYIGDSTTDLACLIRADVGILMCPELPERTPRTRLSRNRKQNWVLINGARSSPSSYFNTTPSTSSEDTDRELEDNPVVETLRKCGFRIRHVTEHEMLYRRVDSQDEESPFIRLLWARDFNEILECGMLGDRDWKLDMSKQLMQRVLNMRNGVQKS